MNGFQPCISGAFASPRILPCRAGLSSQNQKLRDRVAALLNEARYKESVNTSLKEEISRMIPMTGTAGQLQARPPCSSLLSAHCIPEHLEQVVGMRNPEETGCLTQLKLSVFLLVPGDASHFTAGEAHDSFVAPPASLHYTAPMQH